MRREARTSPRRPRRVQKKWSLLRRVEKKQEEDVASVEVTGAREEGQSRKSKRFSLNHGAEQGGWVWGTG